MRTKMYACVFLTVLVALTALGQEDCTREYKGDLVLTGDQRLVITEGTLCVHGNIYLHDDARLEIIGARLRVVGARETLWEDTVSVEVHDRARLELRDAVIEVHQATSASVVVFSSGIAQVRVVSTLTLAGVGIQIRVHGDSSAKVESTPLRRVSIGNQATLEIVRSSVDWDIMLNYEGSRRVVLDGLREGFHPVFEISGGGFRLSLKDTRVGGWLVDMNENAHVTVRDSTLNGVHLGLSQVPRVIERMRPGTHALWSYHGEEDATGWGNLILINSSLRFWVLHIRNLRAPLTLRSCHLGVLALWTSTSPVRFENTVVENLYVDNGHLTAECASLTLVRGTQLDQARLDLTGDVRFQYTHSKLLWGHSSSIRDYEVRVRDRAGQPTRGVQLRLEDPSGGVTTHTTDQDGVLRFTIRFDDTNYDKTWHLVTQRGDAVVRVPVRFTTDTPLIVAAW